MSDFWTALTALWVPLFALGSIYLVAVVIERMIRTTDPRDLVDRAHKWGGDE